MHGRIEDRHQHLDSTVEIARHEVGRRNIDVRLGVWQVVAAAKPDGYTLGSLLRPLNISRPLAAIAALTVFWSKPWVVDCRGVGSGAAALKYLATYIFRVALSNNRIVRVANDHVTFRYVDGATHQKEKHSALQYG